jgi:riboflavin kinase/FMN adenylyltransferase
MERILDYRVGQPLPKWHGGVATIGVFDGLHLGHRAILDRTLSWARTEQRPALLITFGVHPDLVVHGRAPEPLLSLDHRLREVGRAGIDAALVLQFDAALRELSAEAFVEKILVGSLRVHGVVLGHDTAVGRDRRGDAERLTALGAQHGFEVASVGRIAVDGEVVSSTRIRELLKQGDLDAAARLLGRSPSVLGTVVHGDERGRKLGFPTANLDAESECHPGDGVYVVLVLAGRSGERRFGGVANIGRRPTFEKGRQGDAALVEVHVLDFSGDLYGERLEVVFLKRLREERKFASADALVRQIEVDRAAAEEFFRRNRP